MTRALFLMAIMLPTLFSQVIGVLSPLPPQLTQYLDLTDEQVRSIVSRNETLRSFEVEKQRRSLQVELELALEGTKPTIDAMALGLRHAELETIRREIDAERKRISTEIANALTPAQKTKVQTLQQAMQLQPVICAAQNANILAVPQSRVAFPGNIIPSNRIGSGIGALLPSPFGCGITDFVRNPFPLPFLSVTP